MQSSHIAHNALSRRSFIAAGAGAAAASLAAAGSAMAAEGSASADAKGAADASAPKYIFLFIGDGMGNEQVQIASFFKGTTENAGAVVSSPLSFMQFPTVGSVTTYDSSSFCPDSASTATSIATGHKTLSGTINMDPETLTTPYETIAEKLHSQKGFKVGVLTTVNMNHATPAAFYGHQAKRSNYYELGEELAASGFEYFAGGAFLAPTGKEEDKTDLRDVATEAGYTV
ncbi:MAG: alkaline phosphatase, partial [Coriobacteriia bacterium]|nr:alkaline phosphatase [Coriobacteriia bacterium]